MKLEALKKALKGWCTENKSTSKRIKHIKEQVQLNLDRLQNDPFNDLLHKEEADIKKELSTWLILEENHYRQKSIEDWLQFGDKNTKFFSILSKDQAIKKLYWSIAQCWWTCIRHF